MAKKAEDRLAVELREERLAGGAEDRLAVELREEEGRGPSSGGAARGGKRTDSRGGKRTD